MAKPITIPNTFASATSAIPLSQLDQDFSTLANATNDLATYSNYVADTGAADAYIANFPANTNTASLTAGLTVQFKAANANTGASTLNVQVNGSTIGTAAIRYANGSALAAGAIAAGAMVSVMYDGTNFQLINDPAGQSGGDVTGPSSATDNAIARFDGTSGKLIQNSVVTIADTTGDMSGVGTLSAGNVTVSGTANAATLIVTGNSTLGDASGDTLTITGTTVTAPNGLNFDSNTLVIDAANNRVGIGSASPSHTLDVNGPIFVRPVGGEGGEILLANISGSASGILDMGPSNTLRLINSDNSALQFSTNATARMTISAAGDVGIGTGSPGQKLDVAGNIVLSGQSTADQYIRVGSSRTGNGYSYIDLQGDTTYSNGLRLIRTNSGANSASNIEHRGTGAFQVVTQEAAPIVFYTTAVERMRIGSTGNVGIGTSNPGVQLQVNSTTEWGITLRAASNTTTFRCLYLTQRALGSLASPLTVTNGTIIGGLEAGAYNGSAYTFGFNGGSAIQIQAAETWTTTSCATQMLFYTNASGNAGYTERLRIDSAGRLSIGPNGTTSGYDLSINTSAQVNALQIRSYNDPTKNFYISNDNGITQIYADGANASLRAGTLAAQPFSFFTNSAERMRIDSSGNFLVGATAGFAGGTRATFQSASGQRTADFFRDNSIASDVDVFRVIANDGGGTVVASARTSGVITARGIQFPVTQSPSGDANTLDDYEEGSWTPVFTASGTAPTGVTYGVREGRYTKVGNIVYVRMTIELTSKGTGGVGDIAITGLPFNPGPYGGYAYQTLPMFYYAAGGITGTITAALYDTSPVAYIGTPNSATNLVQWSTCSNTEKISFSGVYMVG